MVASNRVGELFEIRDTLARGMDQKFRALMVTKPLRINVGWIVAIALVA
jgi:hypothetical protein